MHVIAVSTTFTTAINVLFALGIEEISHRRKMCIDLLPVEETTIDVLMRILRKLLLGVLHIYISDDMVA